MNAEDKKETKETISRKRRELGILSDSLLSLNISLDDDKKLIHDNETHAENDTLTHETNENLMGMLDEAFEDLPDDYGNSSLPESTTTHYFEYDHDNNYVWDIFDYHRFEGEDFNFTDLNDSAEDDIKIKLSEHYQDPKDKWETLRTKFKTLYRNISVYDFSVYFFSSFRFLISKINRMITVKINT